MKKMLTVVLLTAACSTAGTYAVAANGDTRVKEVTGYDGDDEGFRVVEVTTPSGPRLCIMAKDNYGGSFPSAEKPRGYAISISCDWSPK